MLLISKLYFFTTLFKSSFIIIYLLSLSLSKQPSSLTTKIPTQQPPLPNPPTITVAPHTTNNETTYHQNPATNPNPPTIETTTTNPNLATTKTTHHQSQPNNRFNFTNETQTAIKLHHRN